MFDAGPLFSLVVPLYKTKPQYLREMIDSVTAQTYGNWELCMALAASGEEDAALISILEEFDESTPVYFRNDNGYTYGGITEGRFEEDYGEED